MTTLNKRNKYNPIGFLSGFVIKILACIFMTVDHVGVVLFPFDDIFRIIGRIAFPLFAFLIAEGCHYTKNKLKHFALIFAIGIIYLLFYYVYDGRLYASIFLTFSLSILLIYLLQFLKKWTIENFKTYKLFVSLIVFGAGITATYYLSTLLYFDYGFWGMLVPVFASLFRCESQLTPKVLKELDNHYINLLFLAIGLILTCTLGLNYRIQTYCLLALIPLLFYNGKAGYKKLKYAFYVYYPLHLVIIEAIAIFI